MIGFYDPAQVGDHIHNFALVRFGLCSQYLFDIIQTCVDVAQTGVIDQYSSENREAGDRESI